MMSVSPARVSFTVAPSSKPLPAMTTASGPALPAWAGDTCETASEPPRSKAPMSHLAPIGRRTPR